MSKEKADADKAAITLVRLEMLIKLGFCATLLISMGSFLLAFLPQEGPQEYAIIAQVIFVGFAIIFGIAAFGIWKKSRIATTAMFIFFLLFAFGLFAGNIWTTLIALILLLILGLAMFASYKYHRLKNI